MTVIEAVVAPFDHVFEVGELEVNVTLCPVHKFVVPLAVIVGVAGIGLTTMLFDTERLLHVPWKTFTK